MEWHSAQPWLPRATPLMVTVSVAGAPGWLACEADVLGWQPTVAQTSVNAGLPRPWQAGHPGEVADPVWMLMTFVGWQPAAVQPVALAVWAVVYVGCVLSDETAAGWHPVLVQVRVGVAVEALWQASQPGPPWTACAETTLAE